MSKWRFTLDAKDPDKPDTTWEVGVKPAKIELLVAKSDDVWLARLLLVRDVLLDPLCIIKGWGRDKQECFVYVGKPTQDFRSATIQTPAPPGQFFLVFVLPDGEIDLWTWRPASTDDPDMPDGMKGELVWQRTT